MKRKVLSLLLCGLLACSMLTACGGSNSSNNAEVSDSDVSEKKDAEAANIEDLYVEAINSYQDYYEKIKSDFSGSQVGATITLDEEGLPLLWVAISEDGSKDNCRTQLVGYVDGEAAIMAERSEYIVPGLSSEIILGYGRINGNKRNIYVWDESKQDFRNIANEIGFESDVVYSEEELEEKINFLYPVVKALNTMSGSIQVLMNETTSQVAYIGYYDCSVFDTLQRLDVIGGLSDGGGETYGFYLKKEYSNNKVALSYYEKLADNNRLSADEEDAWWKKKYGSDMASDVIKDAGYVFTSKDGTVLSEDEYDAYLNMLEDEGWERAGLSHAYANDVEMGQLLRGLANKPIYSQEELYLYMVSILYNCEITEISSSDYDIHGYIEEENANKWRDIYLDGLEDGTIMNVYHYGLIDLIGDGIPELLCDDGFNTAIYTIVEDEVVQLTYTDGYPRAKDDLVFFDGKYEMKVIKICTDNVEVLFKAVYDREYDNYEFDGKTLSRDESLAEAGKVMGTDVESLPSVDLSYDVDSIEDAIKEY